MAVSLNCLCCPVCHVPTCAHHVSTTGNRTFQGQNQRENGRFRGAPPIFTGFNALRRKHLRSMVAVAQLVRALDCGSRCRGFDSLQPPLLRPSPDPGLRLRVGARQFGLEAAQVTLGHATVDENWWDSSEGWDKVE
jgi:hypothetical protein